MPQIKKGNESFTSFIAGKNGIIEKYMKKGILGFRLDVVDELANTTTKAICSAAKRVNSWQNRRKVLNLYSKGEHINLCYAQTFMQSSNY